MPGWKLQCYFCNDTVSTLKLNKEYYLMHLVAVHNIQQQGDRLLQWVLSQQGVGLVNGFAAVEKSEKGHSNHMVMNGGLQKRKPGVPAPLLKMSGITVTVDPGISLAQRQLQEKAVSLWANGCEHGCRICKKLGNTFSSFFKQGLVSHLQTEHKVSEQDYKAEFQCHSLMTRASTAQCMECQTRVKRHPPSWSSHLAKHGLNITSYWLKHIKPRRQPQRAGTSLTSWKPRPRPKVGPLRKAVSVHGRGSSLVTVAPAVGRDSMEVEDDDVNPMDMLEVKMGDTFHMEEEEFDEIGDKDETVDGDINANPIQITALSDSDKPMCNRNSESQ